MRFLFSPLISAYAPPLCPVLERETAPGEPASPEGLRILNQDLLTTVNRCVRCFLPLKDEECAFCSGRNVYFDRHTSLFRLSAAWRRVLRRWKFENERRLFRLFLPALSSLISRQPERIDYIGWIDSGRSGWDLRAYTPCRDLALAVARHRPVGYVGPLLRKRRVRSQSSKEYTDRFLRIRGSLKIASPIFAVKCKKIKKCRNSKEPLFESGENIVLLEDVFTTGATANEAARVLKNAGAGSISIISMLLREELDFF